MNSTLGAASERRCSIASSCALPTNTNRTSGSSRAASTNGWWPFCISVVFTRWPTVRASGSRSRLSSSGPNGSGTPWWTTVTDSGGIGVFAAISERLYSELVISRVARRMIQRLAHRRRPPCW